VKKSLAIIQTILMTLTLNCIAYAATTDTTIIATTGSFSDVPANHWAYDSLSKLAKDGLIEGDAGTFQGNKTLSRYEMAILVSRLMDHYDKADAADKARIDRLSAEFNSELNKLGVRVSRVEAKTNTWIFGDARIRMGGDHPNTHINSGLVKVHSQDAYDYRVRMNFKSELNDSMTFLAEFETANGEKAGNLPSTTPAAGGGFPTGNFQYGSSVGVGLFNITAKKTLGLDEIRVGRSYADFFTHGLWSKSFDEDGVRIIKNIGTTKFTGWTGRTYPNTLASAPTWANGDVNNLTTAQLTTPIGKNSHLTSGYFWYDGAETITNNLNVNSLKVKNNSYGHAFEGSAGYAVGFDTKVFGLSVFGDYLGTTLKNAGQGLPTNPKSWWINITNAKNKPSVIYTAVGIVNPRNVGESAWLLAYRSYDAGSAPAGVAGFDNTALVTANGANGLNLNNKNSDNVKGLFAVYSNVLAKNFVMDLEVQDTYIKNKELTTLTGTHLDTTYQLRFDIFY
jgi:hypothetical protein